MAKKFKIVKVHSNWHLRKGDYWIDKDHHQRYTINAGTTPDNLRKRFGKDGSYIYYRNIPV
jgi:hypothetical protein